MKISYAAKNPALQWSLWLIDHVLAMVSRRRNGGAREGAPVRRVLVCMQAHLGDAILATAVIPVLQRHFPQARLGVLVHPGSVQVVEGNATISWVHTVEHWRLNRRHSSWSQRLWQHWKSTRRCEQSVRGVGYDLAIDLYHHFPNSVPLLRRSGIGRIAGWSSAGFSPWLDDVAHDRGQPMPILARHAALLRLIGVEATATPLRPCLDVSEAANERWADIARAHGLLRPCVVFHVGAHAAYKQWPSERWAEAAERVMSDGQVLLLLGHSASEVAICREISKRCPLAIDLSGRLQWDELVAAIASCQLLVAHDSAAIHVAAAFDRPRVSITTGIVDVRIWSQASPRSVVLVQPMPCSPCERPQGCDTMACIRGVTSGRVLASVLELLATTHAQPPDRGDSAALS